MGCYDVDEQDASPKQRHPNADERRRMRVADFQLFIKQYGRPKASFDPNDRRYRRDIERQAKRMRPDELDELLRGEE